MACAAAIRALPKHKTVVKRIKGKDFICGKCQKDCVTHEGWSLHNCTQTQKINAKDLKKKTSTQKNKGATNSSQPKKWKKKN